MLRAEKRSSPPVGEGKITHFRGQLASIVGKAYLSVKSLEILVHLRIFSHFHDFFRKVLSANRKETKHDSTII